MGHVAAIAVRILLHFAKNPTISHHAAIVLKEVAKVTFKHVQHYYNTRNTRWKL